jgi:uncharacterized protein
MMGEAILIGLALILMVGVMLVSLLPFVPGPALMWVVAAAFGVGEGLIDGGTITDGFQRLHLAIFAIMTVIMVVGSTTDFWMPVVGMRVQGGSCWGSLGSLIGGLVGTFAIPIPIIGTLIGAILGALLFEFIYIGDARKAFSAGGLAMKAFFLGLLFEITASGLILALFILSLLLTG